MIYWGRLCSTVTFGLVASANTGAMIRAVADYPLRMWQDSLGYHFDLSKRALRIEFIRRADTMRRQTFPTKIAIKCTTGVKIKMVGVEPNFRILLIGKFFFGKAINRIGPAV